MPYASDKQRRFMHARHPEIAARWDREAKKAHESATKAAAGINSKRKKKG